VDHVLDDVLKGVYRPESPTIFDLNRSLTSTAASASKSSNADLTLGVVDASVVALTERLHEPKVASFDHRHFAVVGSAWMSKAAILPPLTVNARRRRLGIGAPTPGRRPPLVSSSTRDDAISPVIARHWGRSTSHGALLAASRQTCPCRRLRKAPSALPT
jgi:hypothetical protein